MKNGYNFITIFASVFIIFIGENMDTKVEISKNCCLCYGAKRALDKAKQCVLEGDNVVLYKQLLHNKRTLQTLYDKGARQLEDLTKIGIGDRVVIRAHGEPKSTFEYLDKNNIVYEDCTCPNVARIQKLVEEKDNQGYKIIIIGKYGYKSGQMHPEVYATSNWCHNPILIEESEEVDLLDMSFDKYFLVVQTTFSSAKASQIIDLIKQKMQKNKKFFDYKNTTCNAQHIINDSSVLLAKSVDKMLVVGGKNSSNTKELFNNVAQYTQSFFVENLDDVKNLIKTGQLKKGDYIGLTGGASTVIEELEEIKNYILSVI